MVLEQGGDGQRDEPSQSATHFAISTRNEGQMEEQIREEVGLWSLWCL